MFQKQLFGLAAAGLGAGLVTGLFGAGGGMVLVPLLSALSALPEEGIFSASLWVMLPICLTALFLQSQGGSLPWKEALPYLLGSGLGGMAAGVWGPRIPVKWLHRLLGGLILWGGLRYLWN